MEHGRSLVLNKKIIAIIQSNYIPWKGYFDIINAVDTFVLYDECQYTRRDWRNRNRIKCPQGVAWLTIPVRNKGNIHSPINRIELDGVAWIDKHLASFRHHYAKAKGFSELWPKVEAAYDSCRNETMLSAVNHRLLLHVCELLSIDTPVIWSHSIEQKQTDPTLRLIEICEALQSTTYISGPAARNYLDETIFAARGIDVVWMNYDNYPQYPQVHPPFRHDVTALDALFNMGTANAREYVCRFDDKPYANQGVQL